jgi:hypothetical protein
MRPSPHRRPTWHRSPQGRQARVAPAPKAPTAAAQGWRSSPPSPHARHPVPPCGAQVDNPMGTGLHLLTSDVEQHTGVVPSMLSVTYAMVSLL